MTDDDAKKIAALVLGGLATYIAAPHIAKAGKAVGSKLRKGSWSLMGVRK